jgi:hypothetical protein
VNDWATIWMVLTTGPFQVGFARQLGARDFHLGLIAALPAAVGLLQLPASLRVERGGSKRRFIGISSLLGRLLWLPIALLPFFAPKSARLPLFLLLLLGSSALKTALEAPEQRYTARSSPRGWSSARPASAPPTDSALPDIAD